ncbi:MAG: M56 family metallopeptidase [Pirellulaceae bacterium]
MGLRRVPDLWLTPAKLPPFVWWRGGRACVVLSERAIDQLGHDDLGLVIAHEYAHIRRLDHWFRWIEWGVTVACWWNPLVWYARAARRATEEQACDELVLETQGVAGRHYAHALLNMAELLVATPTRPPAIASAFNSGGCLETRVRMMILDRPIKSARLARGAILALALCLAPVGLGHAQELDAIQRRLHQAVEAGEITEDQARVMLDALRRGSQRPMREGRAERSEMIREFGAELTEAGIERDSIGPALNVARRIAAQRWEQGDEAEVSPQLIERLRDELGLNEAQTDVVLRIAHRLAERRPNPARDGETRQESRSDRDADAAARDAMVDVLREVGVEPDAIRPALATARELAEVMADQGKEFEMPDSIPIRLREQLGLNEEQVNAVIGIAKRLAAAHQGRDAGESNRHAISEKLASVLAEADVDPEAIKPVIAIVWDLAEAVTNDGADRAFNEASDNLRREFSFNDDQVNLVFTLAKQLAANKMNERSEASHGETGLAIKVAQLLTEAELPMEMIKPATDAVLRLANAMSRQADDVDLDLVRARLAEELEMNERQIDVVIGLAMKLVHERQAPERDDDKSRIDLAIPRESREGDRRSTEPLQEQLRDSLAEQGFGADRIERVFGAVRRLANVMREQEDDFELTDEIVNHFREDLDLSDEQIKLALGIAKQLATETRRD